MRTTRCKDCISEGVTTRRKIKAAGRCATHHRAKRKAGTAARKAAHVAKTYNITEAQYQELLAAQGGHCAICPRKPGRKRLSVDHDHACCDGPISCGACVRGLLCSTCNKYLGHLRDEPEAGIRIHDYLKDPPARRVLGSASRGALPQSARHDNNLKKGNK